MNGNGGNIRFNEALPDSILLRKALRCPANPRSKTPLLTPPTNPPSTRTSVKPSARPTSLISSARPWAGAFREFFDNGYRCGA